MKSKLEPYKSADRPDQMGEEALNTLVGEEIVGVEMHHSHGAEYLIHLDSGRSLCITFSDYTKDLYFNFVTKKKEN